MLQNYLRKQLSRCLKKLVVFLTLGFSGLFNAVEAGDMDQIFNCDHMKVGTTRFVINNYPTYQCGWRLVFDTMATVKKSDGNISLTVKTVPAPKTDCACKSHRNNFHLYRARRVAVDRQGNTIPDELLQKGYIDPAGSRTFTIAAINRIPRKIEYYINFDCTD